MIEWQTIDRRSDSAKCPRDPHWLIDLVSRLASSPALCSARHGVFMNRSSFHLIFKSQLVWWSAVAIFSAGMATAWATDVRLKNKTVVHGTMLVMNAMADTPVGIAELQTVKDKAPDPHLIARVDSGWQRFYFPVQQIDREAPVVVGPKPATIPITPPRKQAKVFAMSSVGSISFTGPFDEFGRRTVTIATNVKPIDVIQAITEVAPDHMMIESINMEWKFGQSLRAIPIETLDTLLKKQIKRDNVVGRIHLVRFYAEAGYFPQAFQELEEIAKDFPEKKELTDKQRVGLINYFGVEILRQLVHRKRSAQHLLAEDFARRLATQPLDGAVEQDVQQYIRNYELARQSIERVKLLLGEWQSKLNDPVKEKLVQPLRSEINDQLDFETLSRLDAFVKAEADKQYEPAQRLGLAYTGWILGPANASPDLDQALRVWDARNTVLEYLRSDDPGLDAQLMEKLKSSENIGVDAVLQLIGQLPPILDASDIEIGKPHRVEAQPSEPIKYWVMLPAEYTPHHNYPMVVALRPRHRTAEQTLIAWAGDATDPGLGFNRGYIVISPEYAENNATEYSFGAPAHKYVFDCLDDARKRFSVNSDKVFLAGHGMGAEAAYDIGMSHTDEFAGVLPMGGSAINYCVHNWENASFTDWYAVGNGYDVKGGRDTASDRVLNKIMQHGFKFDFMLVDYLGRNGENLIEEIPRLYDWMELHERSAPPKQFKVTSLRKTDNRFFWATAGALPKDYILPFPPGERSVSPMKIEGKVLQQNNINLEGPTGRFSLRLTPDMVDFEKRVYVKINGKMKYMEFPTQDASAPLNELRLRGDRKRLPRAVLEL